jgi:hypothetical protein
MKKRIRFPITVKRGSCTVKIYRDKKSAAHITGSRISSAGNVIGCISTTSRRPGAKPKRKHRSCRAEILTQRN